MSVAGSAARAAAGAVAGAAAAGAAARAASSAAAPSSKRLDRFRALVRQSRLLAPNLREATLHFFTGDTFKSNRGARELVRDHLLALRWMNPNAVVYAREHRGQGAARIDVALWTDAPGTPPRAVRLGPSESGADAVARVMMAARDPDDDDDAGVASAAAGAGAGAGAGAEAGAGVGAGSQASADAGGGGGARGGAGAGRPGVAPGAAASAGSGASAAGATATPAMR